MPPHGINESVVPSELRNPLQLMEMELDSGNSQENLTTVVSDDEENTENHPTMISTKRMTKKSRITASLTVISDDEGMQEVPLTPISDDIDPQSVTVSPRSSFKSKSDSDLLLNPSLMSDKIFSCRKRNVSFSSLHVRSYNVVFGDHPCCMTGPPLTLGWNHEPEDVMSLDEYESSRAPRKSRRDLRMTCEHRRQILLTEQTERVLQHEERRLFRERQRCRRNCATEEFFILPTPKEPIEFISVSEGDNFTVL
mmetsp:Transcript_18699/g.18012  ORF Transcript_18699/g.18012 Transcript_18699/m.18012 type:complete len:253 (-) Transcript_18699:306-1064(-)|eukprot:CAMPEP_0197827498 /NCGR_PEP_ID=MMETSP1437-20131217/4250_1 /TAXON_ID=49252 ORGANISM="Eucampia antarctica, Strain CCMP1452" /NCGR_SAMPLE_ID=MMETSP1437 /ASSEMBLY_ACC=CAM_ASM_001096 /LENGTH=252 /DNA_ID=CAMNT_0043428347 /DNA_START=210 /DNA_END=968 /DNA_ORIENTATION=-